MRIKLNILPEEIITSCGLREIVDKDRFICIENQGEIYGLPQAGLLEFNDLAKHLVPYGHAHVQHTPGSWTNKEQNITCSLAVNDLGINHNSLNNPQRLINAFKVKHTIAVDMTDNLCTGDALKWNYDKRKVTCFMPDFYP